MRVQISSATILGVRDDRTKEDKPRDTTTIELLENGGSRKSVVKFTFSGQPVDELLTGERVAFDAVVSCSVISGLCYLYADQLTITKLDGKKGGEK